MKRLWKQFQGLSMHLKLVISFSVPLVLIFSVLTWLGYRLLERNYMEQIRYSAEQSFEQAASFLESHITNMMYMLERMDTDQELNTILTDGGFRTAADYGEQWRDYLELDHELMELELSNQLYRCAIYVPDELFYSGNGLHFFPESELESIPEKEEFRKKTEAGGCYITVSGEGRERVLVMLKLLKDGERKSGVARVSLASGQIQTILENTDVIRKGMSCLVSETGNILVASADIQGEDSPEIPVSLASEEWERRKTGDGRTLLVRSRELGGSGIFLYSEVPKKEFYGQARVISWAVMVFVAVIIVSIFCISWLLARYYTRRLQMLNRNMQKVREGNVNMEIAEEGEDEIGQLFHTFNYMTKEIRKLMLEQYRLGRDVKNAELKALQAQINPHFLYNTLDLIYWAAMDYQAKEIMEISRSLAKFYRVSLNRGKQTVTIREEIGQVNAYIKIENYHFENAIHFEMDVEDEMMELGCINLILQPFVENAIMYSLAKVPDRESCHIVLRASLEDGEVRFQIEDDGIGMSKEEAERILDGTENGPGKGYGVKNVNFRIKLCYGEAYGVSYESERGRGTRAVIRIPAMTPEELEESILL